MNGLNEILRSPERKKKRPPRTTPKRWADDRSRSSGVHSASASSGTPQNGATPSSVLVGSPLTRDLSDLSGSYLNGNTAPRRLNKAQIPGSVYPSDQSATSYERPWRHAKILSKREPKHPQPHDVSDGITRNDMIMADRQGVVEVIKEQDQCTYNTTEEDRHRSPLLILLMDPGRKIYELMQLWIDISTDTVRDVLHAVQQGLSEKWRQDYDGLFSVRNNYNQLIHILNVSKYEVQPHEIWVAKPWSMSAKGAVSYARELLNHLKGLNVLTPVLNPRWNFVRPRADDVILALSKAAQARVYVAGGIFKHHHASQFLTFVPPFEANVRVDVLGADLDDASASQLSDASVTMAGSEQKEARSTSISGKRSTMSLSLARNSAFEVSLKAENPSSSKIMGCFRNGRKVTDNKSVDPPPRTKSEPRGLIRALSSLNCACSRGNTKDARYGMGGVDDLETTFVSSEVGMWKVSVEEGSIVSDSFPLLSTSAKSDWGHAATLDWGETV
jgi:hypothetical protein